MSSEAIGQGAEENYRFPKRRQKPVMEFVERRRAERNSPRLAEAGRVSELRELRVDLKCHAHVIVFPSQHPLHLDMLLGFQIAAVDVDQMFLRAGGSHVFNPPP